MLSEFLYPLLREATHFRKSITFCFFIVSLCVLVVGWFWPSSYESESVIFADKSNIIKPLMEGSAQTTRVLNRAVVVREVIQSRRMSELIAKETGRLTGQESPEEVERVLEALLQNIQVSSFGNDYIRIKFTHSSPSNSYRTVGAITSLFLKESADSKRRESKQAFNFIDNQVSAYKKKLRTAEAALKEFNATNLDGTQENVDSRILNLRSQIEERKLDFDSLAMRRNSISSQMQNVNKYSTNEYAAGIYRQQIQNLEEKLANLKVLYTDEHPDIIALRLQINDLKDLALREGPAETVEKSGEGYQSFDPFYQKLRSELSNVNSELYSQEKRLKSLQALLQEEYQRRGRVAKTNAELAELTRDYNVNQLIYEDMLERKEKARLSMTLDIEGQGVTYKIQEPATFPRKPVGIRFIYFLLAGPILGVLIPLGLLFLYMQIDPKIKSANFVKSEYAVPVLADIPNFLNASAHQRLKKEYLLLTGVAGSVFLLYAAAGLFRVLGF